MSDSDQKPRHGVERLSAAAILQASLDGIIVMDCAGRVVEFNPAAEAMFGYTRSAVIGRIMADVIIPEKNRALHASGLARFLATGESRVMNRRLTLKALHANGNEFPVELTITHSTFDGVQLFTGFVRDLSERVRAAAALNQSEEKLRSIVENAPNIIFMIDREFRIQYINRVVAGLDIEKVVGASVFEFVFMEERARVRTIWEQIFESGVGTSYELSGLGPNGSIAWYQANAGPLVQSGQTVGIVIIVTDITDRRHAERETIASLSIAKHAVRARDEFLSIASHELRTPVTSLQLALKSVRRVYGKGDALPAATEVLGVAFEVAERQSQRLSSLIDTLLDVSQMEERSIDLELTEFDLVSAVQESVESFREQLTKAQCPLAFSAHTPVIGRWDRVRIDQVVGNLISNALKYGAGKTIEVGVSGSPERASLKVCDHGIGIASSEQPRIFERFERAVPASHYGGLGLGLYIVRSIVDSLGGTVTVTSVPGAGATFTVDLPRYAGAETRAKMK